MISHQHIVKQAKRMDQFSVFESFWLGFGGVVASRMVPNGQILLSAMKKWHLTAPWGCITAPLACNQALSPTSWTHGTSSQSVFGKFEQIFETRATTGTPFWHWFCMRWPWWSCTFSTLQLPNLPPTTKQRWHPLLWPVSRRHAKFEVKRLSSTQLRAETVLVLQQSGQCLVQRDSNLYEWNAKPPIA